MSEIKKSKVQIIGGAVCGSLMIVSIAIFLILGITINFWHPGWLIPVCSALACGIVGIVTDTITKLNGLKTEAEETKKEEK